VPGTSRAQRVSTGFLARSPRRGIISSKRRNGHLPMEDKSHARGRKVSDEMSGIWQTTQPPRFRSNRGESLLLGGIRLPALVDSNTPVLHRQRNWLEQKTHVLDRLDDLEDNRVSAGVSDVARADSSYCQPANFVRDSEFIVLGMDSLWNMQTGNTETHRNQMGCLVFRLPSMHFEVVPIANESCLRL
jgi:hypothetical protein